MLYILGIILLASIIRFAIGGLWYMPKSILGKNWMESQRYTPEDTKQMMDKNTMMSGFVFTFLGTCILAIILTPLASMSDIMTTSSIVPALVLSGLVWLGFIVPILAQRKIYNVHNNYSWKTFFIDAGHELIALTITSVILVILM